MMRIVLSTPHVLDRFRHETRPYNFVFCPRIDTVAGYPANVDPKQFTLLTRFDKERERWLQSECVNIHDGKSYRLALRQTPKHDKVIPQTFGYVLRRYAGHPEHKSLAPDGSPCAPETRGLLQRASIVAGEHHCVGKETDRRWEQGEDLSLLDFEPVQYKPSAQMEVADETLRNELAKRGLREMMRLTGLSHHTLDKIRRGEPVRAATLLQVKNAMQVLAQP
jgi:hypothetical protein